MGDNSNNDDDITGRVLDNKGAANETYKGAIPITPNIVYNNKGYPKMFIEYDRMISKLCKRLGSKRAIELANEYYPTVKDWIRSYGLKYVPPCNNAFTPINIPSPYYNLNRPRSPFTQNSLRRSRRSRRSRKATSKNSRKSKKT